MSGCNTKKTEYLGGLWRVKKYAKDHVALLLSEEHRDTREEDGGKYMYVYTTEGKLTTAKFLRVFLTEDNKDALNSSWQTLPANLEIIAKRFCDMTIGEMLGLIDEQSWEKPNKQQLVDFFEISDTGFGLGKGALGHYRD